MTAEWTTGVWEADFFKPTAISTCVPRCDTHMSSTGIQFHPIQLRYLRFDASDALRSLAARGVAHIYVVGDSYMRNLYTGVQDILFDRQDNTAVGKTIFDDFGSHVVHGEGNHFFTTTIKTSNDTELGYDMSLTYLHMFGIDLKMLEKVIATDSSLVLFGSMVHDHKFRVVDSLIRNSGLRGKNTKLLLKDKGHAGRGKFRELAHRLWLAKLPGVLRMFQHSRFFIWVTSPFYETHKLIKVNEAASLNQENERYLRYNIDGVNIVIGEKGSMCAAFLDAFHLTKACTFNNCSEDGAHRARFVNRMKFQIVLNQISTRPEVTFGEGCL